MHSRGVPTIGLIVLAVTGTLASTAGAQPPGPVAVHQGAARPVVFPDAPSGTVCAQNNGAPNGGEISAQNYEPEYRPYNSRAAADFTPRHRCVVTTVDIAGVSRDGTSNSVTVKIRDDDSGLPGRKHCVARLAAPGPNFTVPVSDCTLRRGRTYWLDVQVDQDYITQGQWFWAGTDERPGVSDAWKNRPDGWGYGCTVWAPVEACLEFDDYDFIFSVNKG